MGCDSRILKAGSGYAMPPFKTTQSPKLSYALAKKKGGGHPSLIACAVPGRLTQKAWTLLLGMLLKMPHVREKRQEQKDTLSCHPDG